MGYVYGPSHPLLHTTAINHCYFPVAIPTWFLVVFDNGYTILAREQKLSEGKIYISVITICSYVYVQPIMATPIQSSDDSVFHVLRMATSNQARLGQISASSL